MTGAGDFRDRFGVELARASAALAAAGAAEDFRVRFGVSLGAAAAELAAGRRHGGLVGVPPARRRRGFSVRGRWVARPVAIALALVAFAGTAFAAVAIWTPLLGTSQYGYNPGAATSPPPGDQLAALAVLRRPQTDADRGALSQEALTYINDYTKGVRTAWVRLLASVDGEAFVLVPVEERDATASTGGAPGTSQPLANALCLYSIETVGVFAINGGCWSVADVNAGRASQAFESQFFGLAPDGATSATLSSPGAAPLSAPVRNNFFDISLSQTAGPPPLGRGSTVTFTH
ncbi:MAG TPA: hypothetical protein VHX66_00760 [Solirubrobacteraceae bacterium]|nr:hypothetical protein [Solirubrobacteraceae bacterium]